MRVPSRSMTSLVDAIRLSIDPGVLQSTDAGPWVFHADATEDWLQGRTLFGGIQAGLAIHAVERCLSHLSAYDMHSGTDDPNAAVISSESQSPWPVVSFMAEFAEPINPGPLTVTVALTRRGANSALFAVSLRNDIGPRASIRVLAGAPRPLGVEAGNSVCDFPTPHNVPTLPADTPGLPLFMQHLEYRPVVGADWGASQPTARLGGHCRFRQPGTLAAINAHSYGECSMAPLATVADAWPPPVVGLMPWGAPVSSVQWHMSFTRGAFQTMADEWWAIDSEVVGVADGYASTRTQYYQQGRLVALASQIVVAFPATSS